MTQPRTHKKKLIHDAAEAAALFGLMVRLLPDGEVRLVNPAHMKLIDSRGEKTKPASLDEWRRKKSESQSNGRS